MGKKDQITTTDLAKTFGVHPNSIQNWVDSWEREGKIPPVTRTRGGHRRFAQLHVDAIRILLTKPASPTQSEAKDDRLG